MTTLKNRRIMKNEIKFISKQSGWDTELTKEHLRTAKEFGMSRKRFLYNEGWTYDDIELQKLNNNIDKIMENQKYKLASLKSKSGILKEEIVGRLMLVKKLGISEGEFYEQELYMLSTKKFAKYLEKLKASQK